MGDDAPMIEHFSEYMPHGMCLLWEPWLLLLYGGSDVLIFIAYFAIPLALLKVLRGRKDIRHRGLILLFASFILLCGITHAMSVVTLWIPIYPIQGTIKLLTGIVSATTAVVLFRLVPRLIALPGVDALERANAELRAEIAAHEQTLADLRRSRLELEGKVEERTAELKVANARLAVTAREAIHRSRNLITVVASLARQTARGQTSLDAFTELFNGRLHALTVATTAVLQGANETAADLDDVIRRQLEPLLLTWGERIEISGPTVQVGSEAAQQISLAIHELSTNAQKHGALDTPGARIAVTWTLPVAADGDRRLVLAWRETTPAVTATPAVERGGPGFGTRLLNQIVPTMLQGSARQLRDGGGLSYVLDVPVSALRPGDGEAENEGFVTATIDETYGVA
ncbi:sensor histidine kinase [Oceaniglobus roseus]|uniref:sensor histidine kinase n=1 Tax=Oceaniglobus roseus TaxID=1737570 RepID=UPI001300012B|nr:sensor histidine kinase [Kandeliimicrobium roseum]